ncbi:MAG: hypothetical protein M3069_09905 [Chloroflexota bacterium]|nr:hypothetical protein [Chloroflexota bacterium]
MGAEPIRIHPGDAKLFLFRGRPRVLICATEHYGSVVNRAFDFARYLDDAAERGQTLTRLFLLFRELQTARNPHSSLKVDSPDYVAPWPRTGPGLALDGEPRFNLDQWNDEFFARLDRFLTLASERDIVVEVTLFSNSYADPIWALNPLRSDNNLTGVGQVEWPDYTSLSDAGLFARQADYVRRVVQATHRFDNIYYEICNEPGGGVDGHVQATDVDTWQRAIAAVLREEEGRLRTRHLLSWSQAFAYRDGAALQELDASFADPAFDVVNVHPLPDVSLSGRTYQLGKFMGKQLQLGEVLDFCRAVTALAKPCSLDEDNTASLYRDEDGWTIHRKRAWVATLSGCHYDYIDFSIVAGQEAGTELSRRTIRSWMQHLTTFVHTRDLVSGQPGIDWLRDVPASVLVATFGVVGVEYVGYLADSRELDDAAYAEPIAGFATMSLPEGHFGLATFSPTSGAWSPWIAVQGGAVRMELPSFRHDLVLVARRIDVGGG